jgi:hypothetical protein
LARLGGVSRRPVQPAVPPAGVGAGCAVAVSAPATARDAEMKEYGAAAFDQAAPLGTRFLKRRPRGFTVRDIAAEMRLARVRVHTLFDGGLILF